jgi:tetratricopeptide (TPR) repeat protein
VNTASRIQSVAPEMGVAVGVETWEATRNWFEYQELPPATLKGKAEPVRVFHARAPRASLGIDVTRGHTGPFVGRAAELRVLTDLLDATVATRSPRFATIVGEPGLGKSRLVAALLAYVDTHAEAITWRQGRCLPYGSGISFWALGEIVKAQAGILDSDDASVATAKLDEVLPEGEERAWFRERLLPLLGIESGSRAERDEQFTAWRRFLELLAGQRPTVLVVEDLHWADPAMLAFLEELENHAAAVPLLVLGTTRPEAQAQAQTSTAVRIELQPLPDDAAADLLRTLFQASSIAPELLHAVVERGAGNPLFAEEFVRLLRDRDLLAETDGEIALRPDAELPVPESIQSLLAARIDALPSAWKAVLGDAAVIGKVFWSGAVAAMGEQSVDVVAAAFDGLAQRELVRAQPRSSIAEEREYTFWHVLARDVAYAAMPRARRSARHVAAARWIESKAGDRVEDLAQILAHHYVAAMDLAVAGGDESLAAELQAPALRFLMLAGRRALGLDNAVALVLIERALALAPVGHPDRPTVQQRYGDALNHDGRYGDAVAAYEEAAQLFRQAGRIPEAANVIGMVAGAYEYMGDPRYRALKREAVTMLEPLGPTPQLAIALQKRATSDIISARYEDGLAGLDRALDVGQACGFPSDRDARLFRGKVTGWRGLARAMQGDRAGVDEIEEAIATLTAAGDGQSAMSFRINVSIVRGDYEGSAAVLGFMEETLAFGRSRGLRADLGWLEMGILQVRFDLGDLDRVVGEFPGLDARLGDMGASAIQLDLRTTRLRVDVLRGLDPGAERLEWLEGTARHTEAPESLSAGLGMVSAVRLMLGDAAEAQHLLAELAASEDVGISWWFSLLPTNVRSAIQLGDLELATAIQRKVEPTVPFQANGAATAVAAILEGRGELEAAAEAYSDSIGRWDAQGVIPELAFALLGHGRTLLALGRPDGARASLERSKAIFADLEAGPTVRETEALLELAALPLGR